ncbi:hypothetical protein ACJJTC_009961, partial [Scirpophaga incertulas]
LVVYSHNISNSGVFTGVRVEVTAAGGSITERRGVDTDVSSIQLSTIMQPVPFVQPGPFVQPSPFVQPAPFAQPAPFVQSTPPVQPRPAQIFGPPNMVVFVSDLIPIFGVTRKGNPAIQVGRYRFNRVNRTKGPKVRWTCTKTPSGCRASLTTLDDIIIK